MSKEALWAVLVLVDSVGLARRIWKDSVLHAYLLLVCDYLLGGKEVREETLR